MNILEAKKVLQEYRHVAEDAKEFKRWFKHEAFGGYSQGYFPRENREIIEEIYQRLHIANDIFNITKDYLNDFRNNADNTSDRHDFHEIPDWKTIRIDSNYQDQLIEAIKIYNELINSIPKIKEAVRILDSYPEDNDY